MENLPCEELELLTQRLKYAILRKNELITANLFGKWMMAAEANLSRTNELLIRHSEICATCTAQWQQPPQPKPRYEEFVEEQYPPEDPENPFRAPPRRMYRTHHAAVLQFPSVAR